MKHTWKVTLILASLFIAAQLFGLLIIKNYMSQEYPYGFEPPEIEQETSYLPVFTAIIIATALAFILARFNATLIWKAWFFFSITFCLAFALSAFLNHNTALAIALVLAFFKIFRKNFIIHNLSEVLVYGGLAAVFFKLFTIKSIAILLIIISLYDYIAVRRTKHMIKLAKFQSKLHIFAGLYIPYGKEKAILGGGDIGFPLLFSGVALNMGFGIKTLIIPVFTTIALIYLLVSAEKKKYYPAMPFLTAGCFLGYLAMILI